MTLLDVQHVKKIYKTRFQGSQVEALKDIHFTVEKGVPFRFRRLGCR